MMSRDTSPTREPEDTLAPPLLLQLPPELHCLIIESVPLSAHLLYRTQTCATLRRLFDGRLRLSRPHRFDLVEWAQAEREIIEIFQRQSSGESSERGALDGKGSPILTRKARRSIWDTSPTSTPSPAPSKPTPNHASHLSPLYGKAAGFNGASALCDTREGSVDLSVNSIDTDDDEGGGTAAYKLIYGDHPDVSLFVRSLQFIGKIKKSGEYKTFPLLPLYLAEEIHVLSLLSRNGFKVGSLIQLLETQAALRNVETILMTTASFIDAVLWTVFVPPRGKHFRNLSATSPSTHFDVQFSHSTCIDTQAIVVPGPHARKGHGLRSGFKCLCFSHFTFSEENNRDCDNVPFHVIFHDWYDEEEAIGTQDMLENSDITCNACKQSIRF